MRHVWIFAPPIRRISTLRRGLEYAVAIGLATLLIVPVPFMRSLGAAGPDQFTVQLNTVLNNVDLVGNLSNEFWIQNVPVYYASSGTLAFEDNIWNFSSSSFSVCVFFRWRESSAA